MGRTFIEKIKGDWKEVMNDSRFTVGKQPLDKEPSERFKKEILIAEHSPIRGISVKWIWYSIKHWVGVHWVRHKWECYVRTQRVDRTGVPRDKMPQDEPQDFKGEANVQHQIDSWRKRLCKQASEETREYAEDYKETLRYFEKEISDVLVPNCIYRGGCPEMPMSMKPCSFWSDFVVWCNEKAMVDPRLMRIQTRYDLYNKYFYEMRDSLRKDEE